MTETRPAYFEIDTPSWIDRLGTFLSYSHLQNSCDYRYKTVIDLGCGFHANFSRQIIDQVTALHLIDFNVHRYWEHFSHVTIHKGELGKILPAIETSSIDIIVANHVLEHLSDPGMVLKECRRVLTPEGKILINVPSWIGKRFLEFCAFKLKCIPEMEIEDHYRYYSKKELWIELRSAGFLPSKMKVRSLKWGLNTFAICQK